MRYRVRITGAEVVADISDPFADNWTGEVDGAEALDEGPAMVEGLSGDVAGLTAEAEIFPGGGGTPTTLQGIRAFAKVG